MMVRNFWHASNCKFLLGLKANLFTTSKALKNGFSLGSNNVRMKLMIEKKAKNSLRLRMN
jgi:hypothetical protein